MSNFLTNALPDEILEALQNPTALAIAFGLAIALIVISVLILQTFRTKGRSILLIGPCNAGKTALFLRLREGASAGGTVASMVENQDSFTLLLGKGAAPRTVNLVDIPGHPRVRRNFERFVDSARGIIFVVDAVDFLPNKTETAEQLYEVLAHKSVTGMRIPVLLAANKADAGVRSHTVDFIRKRLEKELDQLRETRATLSDGSGSEVALGRPGDPITFESLSKSRGAQISLASISATVGDVQPVLDFIAGCLPP